MILFEKKYQTFDTVYSAARRIFNSLLGVSSGDETLRLMFDILHQKLCVSAEMRTSLHQYSENF